MNIFRIILAAFLVLILVSNVMAQPNEIYIEEQMSMRAFEFRFGPNFTVGNLNGSAISWKWAVSKDQANRIGVSFESGLNFGSATETDNDLPDISEYDLFFRLQADRIHYYPTNSKIAFYHGYGPRLGFGIDRKEERIEDTVDTVHEKTRSLETGLGVIAGVEWFVSRSLSLSGEYGLNTTYAVTLQKTREQDVERSSQTLRSLQLAGTLVQLRIAIYF